MNDRIDFIFDGIGLSEAYKRTTRLAIAAHQDDVEFMAYSAISDCFKNPDEWFSAVVLTDGAGSPRDGSYKNCSDSDMKRIRIKEQQKAAFIGEYGFASMLGYSSSKVKNLEDELITQLAQIIKKSKPAIIYTHNPADKHDTHIAAMMATLKAIRSLSKGERPSKLFGCEVWRALDWVSDEDKISLDCSNYPNLEMALMGVFDSQISGGKRYDEAVIGRRKANATFGASHAVDSCKALNYAIDLTPLIVDDELNVTEFITDYIEKFKYSVTEKLEKYE